MNVGIEPGEFRSCRIRIPGSKSIAHRLLICAALSDGICRLRDLPENEDIEATKRVLSLCGVRFDTEENTTVVYGAGKAFLYNGETADCGESGSTLRFLIPLLAGSGKTAVFRGRGRLPERPQSVYEKIFHEQGLRFEKDGDLLYAEGPLKAGEYRIRGDVSSQFISGLLFALPLCREDSTIIVSEPFESSAYADLTAYTLQKAGIEVVRQGNVFFIKGGQTYRCFDAETDADDSQAVFFAVLSQITGKEIILENMPYASFQADRVFTDIIRRMGMEVIQQEQGYLFRPGQLHGCDADLSGCPDLGPALFALATQAQGETIFRNAGRLRLKESDRIAAMEEELGKLGCEIRSDRDTVYVRGKTKLKGGVRLSGHNDHRIVMALCVLVCGAENPCVMEGAEAVGKSYPGFFDDLSAAGVKTEIC